jgi:hypothetical protein
MGTKIKEHSFEYDSVKYFRDNAHNVEMASFGEKKDPIGAKAQLDVEDTVMALILDSYVKFNTTATINWNETSKADLEVGAALKFFGIGADTAQSFGYEKAKSGKLELMSFAIDEGPLKDMLNKEAGDARNFLAKEGNDARIVTEIWIVGEAELSEHFKTYGSSSLGVKAAGGSLSITASGGKSGSQTVTLSKGTTFAYRLSKVKDWNKDKTHIEDMEIDNKGWS